MRVNFVAMPEILLIFKQNHPEAASLAGNIAAWLGDRGLSSEIVEAGSPYQLSPSLRLVLVLGGDGTILGVARSLAGVPLPILGINFGRVGFLTTFDADRWRDGLELALAGKLSERVCLALRWRVTRGAAVAASGVATNDVVVARGCLARLTSLAVKINNEPMGALRSDGIIIASPLGSPGYSASAGGPALYPCLNALVLTPVCPFLAEVSPLVLSGSATVELSVLDISGDCYLTIDGQEGQALAKKDVVRVEGWPEALRFLGNDASFYHRLKSRAFCLDR